MKLNNSIKLSIANFSLFWGLLIYKVIAIAISVLLFLPVMSVTVKCLSTAGFGSSLNALLQSPIFQNISISIEKIFDCIVTFFEGIGVLATTNTFVFIYLMILVFLIFPFLLKLGDVPASETVYSYMASLNKHSFASNFVSILNKSSGYAILKVLLEIPFWAITLFGSYGLLNWAINSNLSILVGLLLTTFIVVMLSIKTTLFNGWAPSIVVFKTCAGTSLKRGIKAVKRNFWSVLSSFTMVMIVFVAIVGTFGVFSLIIAIPLLDLIMVVFGQVLFFESQGMNYYITPDKIVKPRKLEQADNIKKVKMII